MQPNSKGPHFAISVRIRHPAMAAALLTSVGAAAVAVANSMHHPDQIGPLQAHDYGAFMLQRAQPNLRAVSVANAHRSGNLLVQSPVPHMALSNSIESEASRSDLTARPALQSSSLAARLPVPSFGRLAASNYDQPSALKSSELVAVIDVQTTALVGEATINPGLAQLNAPSLRTTDDELSSNIDVVDLNMSTEGPSYYGHPIEQHATIPQGQQVGSIVINLSNVLASDKVLDQPQLQPDDTSSSDLTIAHSSPADHPPGRLIHKPELSQSGQLGISDLTSGTDATHSPPVSPYASPEPASKLTYSYLRTASLAAIAEKPLTSAGTHVIQLNAAAASSSAIRTRAGTASASVAALSDTRTPASKLQPQVNSLGGSNTRPHVMTDQVLQRSLKTYPAHQIIPVITQEAISTHSDVQRYQRSGTDVSFQVQAVANNVALGPMSILITDSSSISLRLADLLATLKSEMEPATYERLAKSEAAQGYVSFNDLRSAGISVRFDDNDRLILGGKSERSSSGKH